MKKKMKKNKIPKRFFREKETEIIRILIEELQGWKDAKAPTTEELLKLVDRLAKINKK